jgi:hypothetical protein
VSEKPTRVVAENLNGDFAGDRGIASIERC